MQRMPFRLSGIWLARLLSLCGPHFHFHRLDQTSLGSLSTVQLQARDRRRLGIMAVPTHAPALRMRATYALAAFLFFGTADAQGEPPRCPLPVVWGDVRCRPAPIPRPRSTLARYNAGRTPRTITRIHFHHFHHHHTAKLVLLNFPF